MCVTVSDLDSRNRASSPSARRRIEISLQWSDSARRLVQLAGVRSRRCPHLRQFVWNKVSSLWNEEGGGKDISTGSWGCLSAYETPELMESLRFGHQQFHLGPHCFFEMCWGCLAPADEIGSCSLPLIVMRLTRLEILKESKPIRNYRDPEQCFDVEFSKSASKTGSTKILLRVMFSTFGIAPHPQLAESPVEYRER